MFTLFELKKIELQDFEFQDKLFKLTNKNQSEKGPPPRRRAEPSRGIQTLKMHDFTV
jgi:hypothetical protein